MDGLDALVTEEKSKETTTEEIINKHERKTLNIQDSPTKALSTNPERGERGDLESL